MKIKASEFDHPDFQDPDYSLLEVDYYSWIPLGATASFREIFKEGNHRLTLRRNLKTGRFEAVKYYFEKRVKTVVFEGSLEEAIEYCNNETEKYHPGRERDLIEKEGLL